MRGLLVAFAFLFAGLPNVAQATPSPSPGTPAAAGSATAAPDGYVRAHRAVSTTSPLAQAAFDDGLTLLYAFNPEEAERSFQRALAADSSLAIAWWGLAMTHGPNINESYDTKAALAGATAVRVAQAFAASASPSEKALIDAAERRFALTGPSDGDASARAYRDAMNDAARRFPNDDDVQTLAAEAELDVHPWDFFSDDGKPVQATLAAIARLRTVLARSPAHIGAEHLLIHATEESPHPEDALDAARGLASDAFEPAAEHLIHMPAHTFMRVGLYHDAGEANARAVDAYRRYLASDPAGHTDYFGHDCNFGVEAFMMSGESARATELANACRRDGSDLTREVEVRFADWSALAANPGPSDFVLGLVAARAGKVADAEHHAKALTQQTSGNAHIEGDLVLAALARMRDDGAAEIAALEKAVAAQTADGYAEPPRFFMPVGDTLGAAYLRAARYDDAVRTFRASLAKNANDPRALFGLAEALQHTGDADGARDARAKFDAAWTHADVHLSVDNL